jgi:hypothetical protein
MTIMQNGDQEGAAVFEPSDPQQAKAAIDAIQARKVRRLSPELRAKLVAAGQRTRLSQGTWGKMPPNFSNSAVVGVEDLYPLAR